jgi:dihydrofolate reductase
MEKRTEREAAVEAAREIIIVAMTRTGLIGADNRIPWKIPTELQLFRRLTLGSTVIMGRKTLESLGRPLPERRNIVVSTTLPERPGITVCRDFSTAVTTALAAEGKVFYIGGPRIYAQALARAQLLHISWVPGTYTGDRYFPTFDRCNWCLVAAEDHGAFVHETFLRQSFCDEGPAEIPGGVEKPSI